MASPDPRAGRFAIPSADAVRDHLARHARQAPSPWFARLPLLALVVIGGLVLLGGGWASLGLAFVIVIGLFAVMSGRARYLHRLDAEVNEAQAWAMRRYYEPALARCWSLLPRLTRQPIMRHRTVAVMGHCLDDLAQYEAALEVYDHLLDEVEQSHPGAAQLHVHRAIAALGCDRLADADDALRAFHQHIDPDDGSAMSAAYHLARLLQEVRTHHYGEATRRGEGLVARLRPLGVEAGFGHALMAWCHRQAPRYEQEPDDRDAGASSPVDHASWMRWWWRRATLLLSPAAIAYRFPELAPLAAEDPS